jgi:hypothetical protein
MAPRQRQRRIVLSTQQPFSSDHEDLSPSPSETSSDCATSEQEYTNGNSMDNCVRTKGDMAKEDHDIFNLFALVRLFSIVAKQRQCQATIQNRRISHANILSHRRRRSFLFESIGLPHYGYVGQLGLCRYYPAWWDSARKLDGRIFLYESFRHGWLFFD